MSQFDYNTFRKKYQYFFILRTIFSVQITDLKTTSKNTSKPLILLTFIAIDNR